MVSLTLRKYIVYRISRRIRSHMRSGAWVGLINEKNECRKSRATVPLICLHTHRRLEEVYMDLFAK
jgi:hypothetical protein